MKYSVTTFGKWELQRQQLVENLLSDPKIQSLTTKEALNAALLGPVNSAMFEKGKNYVRENYNDKISLKDVTAQSYRESLTVVLKSLSDTLNIEKELLKPHVEQFCKECENSIAVILEGSLKIGEISIKTKAIAIDKLYGQNFKTLYPQLAQQIGLQDPELIEIARQEIEKINPSNFGKNEKVVREMLKYINEIAPKVTSSPEFEQLFQEKTGQSMAEYKVKVAAAKNSSIWQTTQCEEEKALSASGMNILKK